VHAPMDDPKWTPSWLEGTVIIVLVIVVVIAALILLGPTIANTYNTGPDSLWLHFVGQ
jgi:hypothetical protein